MPESVSRLSTVIMPIILRNLLPTGVMAVFPGAEEWMVSKIKYGKPQQFPLSGLLDTELVKNLGLRLVFENQETIDLFLSDSSPEVLPLKQWATMTRASGDYVVMTADELLSRCATLGEIKLPNTGWWVENLRTATLKNFQFATYEYAPFHLWDRANIVKTREALKKPIALFSLCEGLEYVRQLEAAIAGEQTDLEYITTRVTTEPDFSGFSLSNTQEGFSFVVPLADGIPVQKMNTTHSKVGSKEALRRIYRRRETEKLITYDAKLFLDELRRRTNFAQHYNRRMVDTRRAVPLDVIAAGASAER